MHSCDARFSDRAGEVSSRSAYKKIRAARAGLAQQEACSSIKSIQLLRQYIQARGGFRSMISHPNELILSGLGLVLASWVDHEVMGVENLPSRPGFAMAQKHDAASVMTGLVCLVPAIQAGVYDRQGQQAQFSQVVEKMLMNTPVPFLKQLLQTLHCRSVNGGFLAFAKEYALDPEHSVCVVVDGVPGLMNNSETIDLIPGKIPLSSIPRLALHSAVVADDGKPKPSLVGVTVNAQKQTQFFLPGGKTLTGRLLQWLALKNIPFVPALTATGYSPGVGWPFLVPLTTYYFEVSFEQEIQALKPEKLELLRQAKTQKDYNALLKKDTSYRQFCRDATLRLEAEMNGAIDGLQDHMAQREKAMTKMLGVYRPLINLMACSISCAVEAIAVMRFQKHLMVGLLFGFCFNLLADFYSNHLSRAKINLSSKLPAA